MSVNSCLSGRLIFFLLAAMAVGVMVQGHEGQPNVDELLPVEALDAENPSDAIVDPSDAIVVEPDGSSVPNQNLEEERSFHKIIREETSGLSDETQLIALYSIKIAANLTHRQTSVLFAKAAKSPSEVEAEDLVNTGYGNPIKAIKHLAHKAVSIAKKGVSGLAKFAMGPLVGKCRNAVAGKVRPKLAAEMKKAKVACIGLCKQAAQLTAAAGAADAEGLGGGGKGKAKSPWTFLIAQKSTDTAFSSECGMLCSYAIPEVQKALAAKGLCPKGLAALICSKMHLGGTVNCPGQGAKKKSGGRRRRSSRRRRSRRRRRRRRRRL